MEQLPHWLPASPYANFAQTAQKKKRLNQSNVRSGKIGRRRMHCNNKHTIAICMIMPGLFGVRFLPGGCLHHILGYACNLYVFYYCCRGMGVRTLGRTVGLCLKLSILLEFDNKYFRKYRLRAIVVFSTSLHTPPPPPPVCLFCSYRLRFILSSGPISPP